MVKYVNWILVMKVLASSWNYQATFALDICPWLCWFVCLLFSDACGLFLSPQDCLECFGFSVCACSVMWLIYQIRYSIFVPVYTHLSTAACPSFLAPAFFWNHFRQMNFNLMNRSVRFYRDSQGLFSILCVHDRWPVLANQSAYILLISRSKPLWFSFCLLYPYTL